MIGRSSAYRVLQGALYKNRNYVLAKFVHLRIIYFLVHQSWEIHQGQYMSSVIPRTF
ncbi:hypothetical protein C0J52_12980 [Blattella germanica]|nr:hypothetical protein C0J52_12980 [Blattella germanica]